MANFVELACPICKEEDFDDIGLSLHFLDCEKAKDLRQNYYEAAAERDLNRGPDKDEWKHEAAEQQRLK